MQPSSARVRRLGLVASILVLNAACRGGRTAQVEHPDGGPGEGTFDAGPTLQGGGYFCDLPGDNVPGAVVPDGFCIRKFAGLAADAGVGVTPPCNHPPCAPTPEVVTPRVLAFAPNGDLFASSPSESTPGAAPPGVGGIYVLPDDNHDGVADRAILFLQGKDFNTVHGLAFRKGSELLYTVNGGVYALPYTSGDRDGTGKPATMIADLSDNFPNSRWTHTVAVAPDGSLYVSRGQFESNSCPADPREGAVFHIGEGHSLHGDVAISTLRNPMFLRCAPWGTCYAAELSGDGWKGVGGAEKLVEIHDGDSFGYPCCINQNQPAPNIRPAPDCTGVTPDVRAFTLHDTPFGFDFDAQHLWPAPYTGAMFMGFHGSFFEGPWNGTRLGWLAFDPTTHQPVGEMQTLVSGWGFTGSPVYGRVTDVIMAPDGRIFFSDDAAGAIYWVAPKTLRRP